jgi:5-methylcytosine-specific restriction enzyme subunit McrC
VPQALQLVESNPAQLRLSFDQARALMALGRRLSSQRSWWGGEASDATVIRCEPSGTDTWKVTIADAIGCIAMGDTTISVTPKISSPHVLYLLEESGVIPRLVDNLSKLSHGTSLADLFAWWFVKAAERLLRIGISRGYREERDTLTRVVGRIDVVPTFELVQRGIAQAVCEYEEFDEDTPQNRVIKAAAQVVVRNHELPRELRKRAQVLLRELTTIGPLRVQDARATIDRATLHYREPLIFAKALLSGAGVAIDTGGQIAHSFLIRTPELIEAGIRRVLQDEFSGLHRIAKRKKSSDTGDVTFNPDIVIDDHAIADVKYRHFRVDWSRGDLNQALAFATVFGTPKAAVLGFVSSTHDPIPRGISVSGYSVTAIAWMAAVNKSPTDARREFVSRIKHWLGTPASAEAPR